jgi:hypothetical protein
MGARGTNIFAFVCDLCLSLRPHTHTHTHTLSLCGYGTGHGSSGRGHSSRLFTPADVKGESCLIQPSEDRHERWESDRILTRPAALAFDEPDSLPSRFQIQKWCVGVCQPTVSFLARNMHTMQLDTASITSTGGIVTLGDPSSSVGQPPEEGKSSVEEGPTCLSAQPPIVGACWYRGGWGRLSRAKKSSSEVLQLTYQGYLCEQLTMCIADGNTTASEPSPTCRVESSRVQRLVG